MKHLARKKIVSVIVEGPSDDTALGITLNQFFDKDSVYVHIMHGDITTRNGVNSQNIVSKIGNEIKTYAKSYHFKKDDFKQIIHIVDTDATYLSEDKIIVDSDKISYQDDGIHTNAKEKVISRNKQKADNLLSLRSCGNIWGSPYRIYYMSCNLDHVLYDKRNSTDLEKEQNAYNFAKKYRKDINAFLDFMCKSSFSVKGNFKKSWHYIEEDIHSIERYTNLPICFEEAIKMK